MECRLAPLNLDYGSAGIRNFKSKKIFGTLYYRVCAYTGIESVMVLYTEVASFHFDSYSGTFFLRI